MSDMVDQEGFAKKQKGRKRAGIRVDLTPMVDLGFLLISFFVFTAALSKPTVMPLYLPKIAGPQDSMQVKASGLLTLLLDDKNRVIYYEGKETLNSRSSDFLGIRNIILAKKGRTPSADFFVIIKPGPGATYKNTVDMLDEMKIDGVKRYALEDLSPAEARIFEMPFPVNPAEKNR
jgi:biopolymer transport protein ExbD